MAENPKRDSGETPTTARPPSVDATTSAALRRLFEDGLTFADAAKRLNVDQSVAYGVYRRWRRSEADPPG